MNIEHKPPFPWFGGKSRVADDVWIRFGNVENYVEPFFGSGAVLFMRPTEPKIETVNDKDAFVANFWRAVKQDADVVSEYADNPVNEADLQSRHIWLVGEREALTQKLMNDPHFYDAKIAGWWVWGISLWIGHGWCQDKVWRQRPHLGNAGNGVHRKRPHLSDAGTGVHRKNQYLKEYFKRIQDRLRNVRVCCGDWTRILGPSVTFRNGITGVFLDPPYSHDEREKVYSVDDDISAHVREWAIANGENPLLRIALCGYDTEHEMPTNWSKLFWKTNGGYSSQSKYESRAKENKYRETIWFSPYCLNDKQKSLFE